MSSELNFSWTHKAKFVTSINTRVNAPQPMWQVLPDNRKYFLKTQDNIGASSWGSNSWARLLLPFESLSGM